MEHVIRISHKCHIFFNKYVTLPSGKVPSGNWESTYSSNTHLGVLQHVPLVLCAPSRGDVDAGGKGGGLDHVAGHQVRLRLPLGVQVLLLDGVLRTLEARGGGGKRTRNRVGGFRFHFHLPDGTFKLTERNNKFKL